MIYRKKRIIKIGFFAIVFIVSVFLCSNIVWATESSKEYRFVEKWGDDIHMLGLFDETILYFQVGNWAVNNGYLELQINRSQLINTEVSYLTVSLNEQPIQTFSLEGMASEIQKISIPLPEERLYYESTNTITVEAYLRGQTTDACVDDSSISTWLNLFGESGVVLDYVPLLPCYNIAQFYEKFVSLEALDNGESFIATGTKATETSLTTLAHILTGFAQGAKGDHEQIQSGIIQTEADFQKFPWIIYVDTYENLPEYLLRSMTPQQKENALSQAIVCLLEQENTKILLVTGNNQEALKIAGDMLSNQECIAMLTKTQEVVTRQDDYRTEPIKIEEYLELTPYGVEIKGNFEQRASFFMEYPSNRKLAESAELSLDYRYSRNLDFQKSLLTVYINGIPIGSRTLSQDGADGSSELFSIPSDLQITGNFSVETVFELYPLEEWCELTPEEIPWAYIAKTSMLKWTTVDHTEVFWEHYPFPFLKNGAFSNVQILLPKDWTKSDMQTMSSILLTLGGWQKSNHGSLEVRFTFSEEELADKNIIAIGEKSRNLWQSDEVTMPIHGGSAQLLISPYGDSLSGIMKVTGESAIGMLKTTRWLGQADHLWELNGDLMITDGKNLTCHSVRDPEQVKKPLVEAKNEVSDENIPLVISGSLLLLVLLSGVMLLLKYRQGDENER